MKNSDRFTKAPNESFGYLIRSIIWHRHHSLFIPLLFALACFALSAKVWAVDPPPDGGYPNSNTAEGEDALFSLDVESYDNTAAGYHALYSDSSGYQNTAVGAGTLEFNTTGSHNTATGTGALAANMTGNSNTASGIAALNSNTTGGSNTAFGAEALETNTVGVSNTATGAGALANNITGNGNTANGGGALISSTTASYSVAVGYEALFLNITGIDNTAIGSNALLNATGSSNIGIGFGAGSNLMTGTNNLYVGNKGVASESNAIRIGTKARTQTNTYIAGISGVTVAGGVGVIVDTNGHLGTIVSAARFKDRIQPMDKASEVILALEPVMFCYKKELDPQAIPQFGLVAEDVAMIDPDLVARDEEGKPYTVRYEAVNAMLLNEFLKQHRKVEEQASKNEKQELRLTEQQKQIDALQATLREQAEQVRKVSAQLSSIQSATRLVANE